MLIMNKNFLKNPLPEIKKKKIWQDLFRICPQLFVGFIEWKCLNIRYMVVLYKIKFLLWRLGFCLVVTFLASDSLGQMEWLTDSKAAPKI